MFPNCFKSSLIVVLVMFCSACSMYVIDEDRLYAGPPEIKNSPPEIITIEKSPDRLIPGTPNVLTLTVEVKDVNSDIGPNEIRVVREIRKVSGNFTIGTDIQTQTVPIRISGQRGTFELRLRIDIPARVQGVLAVAISVYDQEGNLSEPSEIEVQFP